VVGLEPPDRLGQPVDVAGGRPPPRAHQAHAGRPRLGRPGRRGEHAVGVEQLVLQHLALGALALGAVAAVLGADAGPDVDQEVQLHPATEERAAHLEGGTHDVEDVVVGQGQHGERLLPGRRLQGQGPLGQVGQEICHHKMLAHRSGPPGIPAIHRAGHSEG
jgi:hypothetical protein